MVRNREFKRELNPEKAMGVGDGGSIMKRELWEETRGLLSQSMYSACWVGHTGRDLLGGGCWVR